jgi:hypothetical protein
MNEDNKLRIFAAIILITLLINGYLVKDKSPKEDEYSRYHLHH